MSAERGGDDLDQFVADELLNEQIEAGLRRQREEAQRKAQIARLEHLLTAEQKKREYKDIIREHVPLLVMPKLLTVKAHGEKPRHTWVLVLSDWHVGQSTTFDSTNHVFEQSAEITQHQIRKLWDTLGHLHDLHTRTRQIDDLTILILGDIVDGDGMRKSQTRKIHDVVTKQTMQAVDYLAELLLSCLSRFRRVSVKVVGGNHDRISEKPGDAGLGELDYCDTFAYLIGAILERQFGQAISDGRLDLVNHESFFGTAMIAGKRVVYEHGSSIRGGSGSYGGLPWYPIVNAANKYAAMLGGLDIFVIGHWHVPSVLPLAGGWSHLVMNGALPPSTSFVQSRLKVVGRPTQMLLDIHEEHGLVGHHYLYLEHDTLVRPSHFWDQSA
jgi:predicted phosphodiesterase